MSDAIGDRFAAVLPSGRELSFLDPDPSVITLLAVAQGLAHQWRWGGAGPRRLTVAEHSVQASAAAINRGLGWRLAQVALMHDAHEFLLRDLPPGLKRLLDGYEEVTARIQAACESALAVPPATMEEREAVRLIDEGLRLLEIRRGYAPPCDLGLASDVTLEGLPGIIGFSPEGSARQFRNQFAVVNYHLRTEAAEIGRSVCDATRQDPS